MHTGTVKFYNAANGPQKGKGYGFIIDDESTENVFVHHSDLNGLSIKQDDRLSYDTEKTPQGLKAINIQKI